MAKVKVQLSLDPAIKEKLKQISKDTGLNVSALVTTWVNRDFPE